MRGARRSARAARADVVAGRPPVVQPVARAEVEGEAVDDRLAGEERRDVALRGRVERAGADVVDVAGPVEARGDQAAQRAPGDRSAAQVAVEPGERVVRGDRGAVAAA